MDARVFSGNSVNSGDDSYPGDRFSCIFAGGTGDDGTQWTVGLGSLFQVKPKAPLLPNSSGGACWRQLASTAHDSMQVALVDGSVRSVAPNITKVTWAALLTPNGGDKLGPDWAP